MHGRNEMHKIFWLENLKGKDNLEDLGVGGLDSILGKCENMWTGCISIRIGTGGRLL
jgi:muramidase (phage lysozyme)